MLFFFYFSLCNTKFVKTLVRSQLAIKYTWHNKEPETNFNLIVVSNDYIGYSG